MAELPRPCQGESLARTHAGLPACRLVTQATVPHSCGVLAARAAYDSALLCSLCSFRYGKRRRKREEKKRTRRREREREGGKENERQEKKGDGREIRMKTII